VYGPPVGVGAVEVLLEDVEPTLAEVTPVNEAELAAELVGVTVPFSWYISSLFAPISSS
jgi:hypothetical protein